MKRVKKTLYCELPSVLLFRDDIELIQEEISKICEKVSISDQEFEYESLDEMRHACGDSLKTLEIKGICPDVIVKLDKEQPHLYVEESDQSEALFLWVKDFLHQRRRKIEYLFINPLWAVPLLFALLLFALLLVLVWLFVSAEKVWFPLMWFILGFFVVVAVGIPLFSFSGKGHFNSLNLIRPHERPSFWSRNKDAIIIGILISILSAAAGSIVTWALTR